MKKIFVAVIVVIGLSVSAHASLVSTESGKSTFDTETRLAWLDLTETVGYSVNDILNDANGLISAGYRYATRAEMETFFIHAGIIRTMTTAEQYAPTLALMNLVGITYGPPDYNGWLVTGGIGNPFELWPPTVIETPPMVVPMISLFANITTHIGANELYYPATAQFEVPYSRSGHWLVHPVPIPAAAWLLGSGLVGLIGLRRKYFG